MTCDDCHKQWMEGHQKGYLQAQHNYTRLAIIGSRDFKGDMLQHMAEALRGSTIIITGGARGVDEKSILFARDYGIPYHIIRPINYDQKINYLYRNVEIVALCDRVLAFWDEESKGTKFVIDYAKARCKQIKVINEEGKVIMQEGEW